MTATEYMSVFRGLATMTQRAIDDLWANYGHVSSGTYDPEVLTRIDNAVETLSVTRGDSSIFDGSRPIIRPESGLQNEMYETEVHLRRQLIDLGYKYPNRNAGA